jgi:hypothetical protein
LASKDRASALMFPSLPEALGIIRLTRFVGALYAFLPHLRRATWETRIAKPSIGLSIRIK